MSREIPDSLASFLYTLMRDHLPVGVVQEMIDGSSLWETPFSADAYTNKHLAAIAGAMAEQLLPDPPDEEPVAIDTETTGPGVVPECMGCQTSMVPHRFDCPNSPEVQILAAHMMASTQAVEGAYCSGCEIKDGKHESTCLVHWAYGPCAQCGGVDTPGHVCCRPQRLSSFEMTYPQCPHCGFSDNSHEYDCPYYGRKGGDL